MSMALGAMSMAKTVREGNNSIKGNTAFPTPQPTSKSVIEVSCEGDGVNSGKTR